MTLPLTGSDSGMSRASLPPAEQLQQALQLRELSGPPLSVAAFKRELKLGRQVICIHRDRPRGPCPAGPQDPVVLTVERIQTNNVRFMEPDGEFRWFRFPTRTCGTRLEHLEGGFVLQHPEGDRLIYHWLDGESHAQA